MKQVNVLKRFVLTTEGGVRHTFNAGVQNVEDWVAEHWYTLAHAEALGDAKTPDAAKAETPIQDMNVGDIVSLLKQDPSKATQVKEVEEQRDSPRSGVMNAVKEAEAKAE